MIGHFEELEKYFEFIQNILNYDPDILQPLYSITGKKILDEEILELSGYMNNKPVRIGNAAYHQVQNDVYGQVLLGILPLIFDQRLIVYNKPYFNYRAIVSRLLSQIENKLQEPDAGIWEFRNVLQQNSYTLLFHWAGAMAAKKYATILNENLMASSAQSIIDKAAQLLEQCYNPAEKAYMQGLGSAHMDASTLKLITMQYLNPNSEKAKQHLQAIENKLKSSNGLIYRYRHKDDFGEPETSFLICSFWYTEALTCVGRLDDAINSVEQIIQ